jgi:integrase
MPRPKRSIELSEERFPGWTRIEYLYNKCPTREHEILFLVLFSTGARVSEAITLQRSQVAMNEGAVYVYGAPVLKQKKRVNREIMIPNIPENPLYPRLVEYLSRGVKMDGGGYVKTTYLLPAYQKFTHELIPDMHTTRSTVYTKLREIAPELYPHQLRGWCAGYLAEVHDLNVYDLMTWFGWKTPSMAAHYARTREKDLEAKLGIEAAPKLNTRGS